MVSFAKVAEYQQRAAIHFHAVVRLDGPSGPGATRPLGPLRSCSPTPYAPLPLP